MNACIIREQLYFFDHRKRREKETPSEFPKRSPAKRVRFGEEEGGSGYEVFGASREAGDKNEMERASSDVGQAIKGARGMPWHQEPKKDVTSCDKPRGAAHTL